MLTKKPVRSEGLKLASNTSLLWSPNTLRKPSRKVVCVFTPINIYNKRPKRPSMEALNTSIFIEKLFY